MTPTTSFDVIIVGGSYSGLSSAMALGRALRKVLIIDSGLPCNRQTPHSHNFITHDGKTPGEVTAMARQQVAQYSTVQFVNGLATAGKKLEAGFGITTASGESYYSEKLVFATGVRDLLPPIDGVAECWGVSVIHCPYCHGYEVRGEKTGILGDGNYAFDFSAMISNWTKDLTVFTNGKSTLTADQATIIGRNNIRIIEKEIDQLDHTNGQLRQIVFKDKTTFPLTALYTRPPFEQHCKIPQQLGCELTEQGFLKVDVFQKTTVPDIYACGDNTSGMRTLSNAIAMGTMAGMGLNKEMVMERFVKGEPNIE